MSRTRVRHISSLQRALAGITVGMIAALTAGCSSTAPPAAAAPPAACRTSTSEAQALWDPLHDGTGGYGDTPSLTDPPSLYTTAWSLQLAVSTHTATPDVDRDVVARWLGAGATDPSRFSNESELSPLARIQLAVSTLKAISAPEPSRVSNELEALRKGGYYRDTPTASPAWPATALAALTLADLGDKLPAPVVHNAETEATKLTAALRPQQIDETGVPILLTLAASDRGAGSMAYPADLGSLLRSWSNTELAAGPSAVTLGDLYDIHLIAHERDINLPALPQSFFGALRTSGGSYGLAQTAAGDPQITYYAVALGAAFPSKAHAILALGQARNGWLANESPPTALDTYQAAVIAALCTAAQHPVSSQLLYSWITSSVSTAPQTTHPRDVSATLAESCWLARDQQTPLPAAALTAEEQTLTSQIRADEHSAAAGRDLAAADVCGVTLPAALLALLHHDLTAVRPATMPDAFDLYIAARTLKDSKLLAAAQTAAARLRTATSAYRYNTQARTPDLISTAQGFMICSPPNAATRNRILTQFATPSGPALNPPGTTTGSTLTVSMGSLTAAVVLEAGVTDPQYLL